VLMSLHRTRAQLHAAFTYVGLNLLASAFLLTAIGLLYGQAGTLNLADLARAWPERRTPALDAALSMLFLTAFGIKAGLFPLFFWLPASYHTPSFTTSALFAALLTKVGVYALIRVFTLVYPVEGTPIQPVLLWGAVLTLAVGAFGALAMNSTRRVLGFTVISSIGGMILGLAVATPLAVMGALVYLVQDVLVKAGLFLGAGAAGRLTGSERFGSTGGLWRRAPWFALVFLIPALSLAGVPPLSGFWPKLILVQATLEAGRPGLTFALLAAGLLTLFAMGRVWAEVFWAEPAEAAATAAALPAAMLAPLVALAAAVVLLGVGAGPLIGAATTVAAGILDPAAYVAAVLGAQP
jgi:multicomponent Na+:H+ antiporter subunit D